MIIGIMRGTIFKFSSFSYIKTSFLLFSIGLFLVVEHGFGQSQTVSQNGDNSIVADQLNIEGHVIRGTLKVPENHDDPNSVSITLSYAVLKAKNNKKATYPLIYLSGGPGSHSLTEKNIGRWQNSILNNEKDIILFDQRGINQSSALPNMSESLFKIQAYNSSLSGEQKRIDNVIIDYRRKADSLKVKLENYNSSQNSKDVGALMDHLGYEKYNLYGISYGTRLARTVQDMFPDKIHSVTLNSPALPDEDFLLLRLKSYALSLKLLFEHCKNDGQCAKEYPNLDKDYVDAINSLDADPIKVSVQGEDFFLNPQDGMYLIRRNLYSNKALEKVPTLINAILNRENGVLKDALQEMWDAAQNYNYTLWIAMETNEQFDQKNSTKDIDSLYGLTSTIFPSKLGLFTSIYNSKERLHDMELPLSERNFKTSHTPTLIFVNYFDPITPPVNGRIFKKKLTDSKLFVLDEGGHGGGNNACREKVMQKFMDNPIKSFDISCLNLHSKKG